MVKSYLQYIDDLFESYYNSKNLPKSVDLRAEIERLVLTGEQILESGIANLEEVLEKIPKETFALEKELLENKLENYKEVYKKALIKLAKKKHILLVKNR